MISRELNSLDNLMDGALVERFNAELQRLMENVYDLRTAPDKVRQISLIFKFKPNDRRDAAEMTADVITKMPAPLPLKQTVLMGQADNGHVTLVERVEQLPGQQNMDGGEQLPPRVVEFGRIENKA